MENYHSILDQVDKLLDLSGIHGEFKEEMIDHYMSEYESQIAEGISPHLAARSVYQQIAESGLKPKKTIKFDKQLLILSILAVIISGITFYLSLPHQPPQTLPFKDYKEEQLTASFGNRCHPIKNTDVFHKGIDLKAPLGQEISSPLKGVVKEVGYSNGRGNYVVITHNKVYSTAYSHLANIHVVEGQKIKSNETIGFVGITGLSTGPHLHYEVWKNDKPVDPIPYLKP